MGTRFVSCTCIRGSEHHSKCTDMRLGHGGRESTSRTGPRHLIRYLSNDRRKPILPSVCLGMLTEECLKPPRAAAHHHKPTTTRTHRQKPRIAKPDVSYSTAGIMIRSAKDARFHSRGSSQVSAVLGLSVTVMTHVLRQATDSTRSIRVLNLVPFSCRAC